MDVVEKILTVATDNFRQFGFKSITMDDIARKAGISKKTLYLHFASKTAVVVAAMIRHQQKVQAVFMEVISTAENSLEGLVRVNAVMSQMFRQINPLAMLELQRYFPDAYSIFRSRLMEKDIAAIRENLIRGMEEGLYRPGLDADLLARFRVEVSLISFQSDSLLSELPNQHEVRIGIMENYLYGIMTPKGEKLYKKYSETYLKDLPKI